VDASTTVQLYGKLHIDFWSQPKYLIPNAEMKIVLTLNKPEIICQLTDTTDNTDFKHVQLNMLDMKLHMEKITPDYAMRVEIENALKVANAKYFYSQNIVTTRNIPDKITSYMCPDILSNILPRFFMIGFIPNANYTGTYGTDAFTFADNKIKSIAAYKGGELLNGGAYEPDYANNLYAREYYELYRSLNQHNNHPSLDISYADFKSKFCFYAFNLSPDMSNRDPTTGVVSPVDQDTINIELVFKSALTAPLTMVIYSMYNKYSEINQGRELTKINFP